MLRWPKSALPTLAAWAPITAPSQIEQVQDTLNALASPSRRGNSDISDFQSLRLMTRLPFPVLLEGLHKAGWMSATLRKFALGHLHADTSKSGGPDVNYGLTFTSALDTAWEVQVRLVSEAINRAREPVVGSTLTLEQVEALPEGAQVRLANGDVATLVAEGRYAWEVERGAGPPPGPRREHPLAFVEEALEAYGATLTGDGYIQTRGGKVLSVRAVLKGSRLRMEQGPKLVASGAPTVEFVQEFVERFWFWTKSAVGDPEPELSTEPLPNIADAAVAGGTLLSLPDADPFLEELHELVREMGWPTTSEEIQWGPPDALAALPAAEAAQKTFFPVREQGKGANRHTVRLYSAPDTTEALQEQMGQLRESHDVTLSDQEAIVQCLLDAHPYYAPLILAAWQVNLLNHQAAVEAWATEAVRTAQEELTYLDPSRAYVRPATLDVEDPDSVLDFLKDLLALGGTVPYPEWFSDEERAHARALYQSALADDVRDIQDRFAIPHYRRLVLSTELGNQALFHLFVLTPYFKGRRVNLSTVRTILQYARQEPA